jgi:hypothetical protein
MIKLLKKSFFLLFWNFFYFKRASSQFNFISKQMDPYTWTSRSYIHQIAKLIEPNSIILDVGSGPQWARFYFEKYNHEYLGCDIEESRFANIQDFYVTDELLPWPDKNHNFYPGVFIYAQK